jgi:hypothetical protein
MNQMISQKKQLFQDLNSPMKWLDTKNMLSNGPPTEIENYGDTVFFVNEIQEKWHSVVSGTVLSSSINKFGPNCINSITVQLPRNSQIIDQLKKAAMLVYNNNQLPCTQRYATFEEFWVNCGRPVDTILVEAPCFSRRGRKKDFINIYDENLQEITGKVCPCKNAKVEIALRFSFSETEDSGHFGFRALFGSGIILKTFGGDALVIKRPWDIVGISENLTVKMHDSFLIKSPALTVTDLNGNVATVDMSTQSAFLAIIQQIHQKAGKWAWNSTINVCGNKIAVDDVCIFQMWCEKTENGTLEWCSSKIVKSRKRKK